MELVGVEIMRGPNYWSAERSKLIVLKVETGSCDEQTAERKEKAFRMLQSVLPLDAAIADQPESAGQIWCAGLIRDTAISLQRAADINVVYGDIRWLSGTKWAIIFEYRDERTGELAGESAFECVKAAWNGDPFDVIGILNQLREIHSDAVTGPSTQSIIDEAGKRNIPCHIAEEYSLVRLGYGKKQRLFQATVMQTTSNIGVDLAASKWMTKKLLAENGISVPEGIEVKNKEELTSAVERLGTPLVVKPLDGNHGRGITANLTEKSAIEAAYQEAAKISDIVLMENHVEGDDHRLLVINSKFVAAARRTPPMITGDGKSTIMQLVNRLNEDPDRGLGHEKTLTEVSIDVHTLVLLAEQGLAPESVLPEGRTITLKRTANLSSGGTAEDVTDIIHPSVIHMAERIAGLLRLDVCGIDIVTKDITMPLNNGNGAVIEVNAGPGFRMHTNPSEGKPRNVAAPVIDMLFPGNSDGRIPVIAVTGTNGKTTVVRIIAHIATHAGRKTGFTTTEGIYIGGNLVMEGDCSGPKSAAVVLNDAEVEYAVLECARGGILRSGLAFDQCCVSVVTNVTEDHLGLGDINTIEEYARVKQVVPMSTLPNGTAVLNADDDLVYNMKDAVNCAVLLFSTDCESERLKLHCSTGGSAITLREGKYILKKGSEEQEIVAVNDIPLTENGRARFMVKNILAAIAAALSSGFTAEVISDALKAFRASPETTPGRMNLFRIRGIDFMLDYAHNAGGFLEIGEYMKTVNATRKIGIIAATGDRKDSDIIRQGELAAGIFSEIIIRHETDSRGRENEELTKLLMQGVRMENPSISVKVISDEEEAMRNAIESADSETFVFTSADHVFRSIELLRKLEKEYGNEALQTHETSNY